MKKLIQLLLLLLLLSPVCVFSQVNACKLEKTTTFFPEREEINQDNIEFNYLTVPENWDNPSGKKIKIAVAILRSTSKSSSPNPVVYIEGGPGAGGIGGISSWSKHPIRENSDIILMDARGTGNSLPKFCPDLGEKFLEILSKNQDKAQDEQQKIMAAMACKQDLINRDIDLNAYNSKSIAKDLNALKRILKYNSWNVYGVSYGTYIAQVYANDFPQDVKSIVLDSSIPDIAMYYYNTSTSKYMNSLKKVFDECEKNPNCNKEYPDLEKKYYEIIEKISKNPITVKVDKKTIPSGSFTYNVEDFKVCIQQSLYQKKLIEVIPLLITQFHKEDKSTLRSLVAAFSGSLSLDYGTFYCVTCNEAFPYNSIAEFNKDASQYEKLKGGLSFYKSDFQVCDKWNMGIDRSLMTANDLSNLSTMNAPVLVYSGAFDPITPPLYGKITANKFKNGFLVNAPISGHIPGFSKVGYQIIADFIKNPSQRPNVKELESDNKIHFVTGVNINGGVSSFGDSLNKFDILFFAPLFIAFIILIISIVNFCYVLIRNKKETVHNKLMMFLIAMASLLGLFIIIGLVLAINTTAQDNFYILAFGLSNQFSYLFNLQWVFILITSITLAYFLFRIKFISDTSIIATILFSLILIGVYFQYWGFLL